MTAIDATPELQPQLRFFARLSVEVGPTVEVGRTACCPAARTTR